MKWFVFVDVDYYPYVGDEIEAETREEALALAGPAEEGVRLFVAPADSVSVLEGPPRRRLTDEEALTALRLLNSRRADMIMAREGMRDGGS